MRTLAVTQNITIDGVIDLAGGWFAPGDDSAGLAEVNEVLQKQAAGADSLLLGRVSFEDMRAFWPGQSDDTTGNTSYLNSVDKFVVSSTMEDPRWQNTTILHGDLHEEVTRLKSRPGKDIVATGSITLVHELIRLGLVDEYRLFIYPVVAGQGRRLFENATSMLSLRLGELQRFGNGIALAIYRIN